jgi:hypothetical protein
MPRAIHASTCVICCDSNKDIFQRCKSNLIGDIDALSGGDQMDIPMLSKNLPVLPEILPSKTLDTVALCGVSNLARYRNAEATAVKMVFVHICDKVPVFKPLPVFGKTNKIRSLKQPVAFCKSLS